jgi:hypothetical protein
LNFLQFGKTSSMELVLHIDVLARFLLLSFITDELYILTILACYLEIQFQEDVPEEFASHILNFISRNKIGPNGVEVST